MISIRSAVRSSSSSVLLHNLRGTISTNIKNIGIKIITSIKLTNKWPFKLMQKQQTDGFWFGWRYYCSHSVAAIKYLLKYFFGDCWHFTTINYNSWKQNKTHRTSRQQTYWICQIKGKLQSNYPKMYSILAYFFSFCYYCCFLSKQKRLCYCFEYFYSRSAFIYTGAVMCHCSYIIHFIFHSNFFSANFIV